MNLPTTSKPTKSVPRRTWAFRILVILNTLLLAAAFFYRSTGEDPAGAGLRLGFALVYAIAFGAVLLVSRFARSRWMQMLVLILLAAPFAVILYGIIRSV